MYLYTCDIYTQLGYLFKAETSIATIKKTTKKIPPNKLFLRHFHCFFFFLNIYQLCKLHKNAPCHGHKQIPELPGRPAQWAWHCVKESQHASSGL